MLCVGPVGAQGELHLFERDTLDEVVDFNLAASDPRPDLPGFALVGVPVVEYKGEACATNDDSREKKAVGPAWHRAAAGRTVFVMVERELEGLDMRQQLMRALAARAPRGAAGHQPRPARRALPHAVHASDGEGGVVGGVSLVAGVSRPARRGGAPAQCRPTPQPLGDPAMNEPVQKPTGAFVAASWAAMLIGAMTYLVGLWNSDMLLNEKGYYLVLLMYGLFASVSLQKSVRDRMEGISVTGMYFALCWVSVAAVLLLLTVGLWNAKLSPAEKGFYAMSFVLALFASVAVQKNVRDLAPFKAQEPQTPRE